MRLEVPEKSNKQELDLRLRLLGRNNENILKIIEPCLSLKQNLTEKQRSFLWSLYNSDHLKFSTLDRLSLTFGSKAKKYRAKTTEELLSASLLKRADPEAKIKVSSELKKSLLVEGLASIYSDSLECIRWKFAVREVLCSLLDDPPFKSLLKDCVYYMQSRPVLNHMNSLRIQNDSETTDSIQTIIEGDGREKSVDRHEIQLFIKYRHLMWLIKSVRKERLKIEKTEGADKKNIRRVYQNLSKIFHDYKITKDDGDCIVDRKIPSSDLAFSILESSGFEVGSVSSLKGQFTKHKKDMTYEYLMQNDSFDQMVPFLKDELLTTDNFDFSEYVGDLENVTYEQLLRVSDLLPSIQVNL